MDVLDCVICGKPLKSAGGGLVAIFSAERPHRRPLWGPKPVLTA